eukprot:TRINITY_DN50314_c0_g1_i1.p1 TRINITY_DN50314_c0_g1~~TRINITY_DN50314_c0_g1_i1.p1  ORF type:complete len:481 (+),score=61.49 TRINITY_DN50314_c0_g1_i1:78-1520(+)
MSTESSPPPAKRAKSSDSKRYKVVGKRIVIDAVTILEPGYLLVKDGLVADFSDSESSCTWHFDEELHADIVVPGFIDIHTHGVGGADEIAEFWQHPEYTLGRVAKYGTTAVLATMVIPSGESLSAGRPAKSGSASICKVFETCSCLACSPSLAKSVTEIAVKLNEFRGELGYGAVLEGIHAEGPIIASLGGLPRSDAEMPMAAFKKLLDALGPALKVMTISPSIEARAEMPFAKLRLLIERGVRPALGHDTSCTLEDVLGALKVATYMDTCLHITHCFNVQKFHHRECGLTNVALLPRKPDMPAFADVTLPTIELIGDSVHVSPLVLQVACACKPQGTACFITDGIAEPVPGLRIKYAGRVAEVKERDGRGAVYSTSALGGDEVLVGSCIALLDAFRTAAKCDLAGVAALGRSIAVKTLGLELCRAVDMCCCTPAVVAKLPHIGNLRVGQRADILLMDMNLDLKTVLVAGAIVHDTRTGA